MAHFDFDASQIAPQTSSGPLPAGTYLAHITESDVQPLKSGKGTGLKLTFEVIDGPHKGRRVWENLNIQHENEDTQRIAQSQLSALCHAVNVIKLQDTAALHLKPVTIKVVVREAQGQYQASNNIKGYEAAAGVRTAAPEYIAPAFGVTAITQAKPSAPAWAKK